MYLCYREPAPGYIHKPTSARRFIMTSAPASTTAPPLQSSLCHLLLPWSRLRRGRAAVLLFPVLPCISIACCFSWRFHAQSTRVCPGSPIPSRLKLPRLHSRTLVHHSHAPLTYSRALLSCTTPMHHSRTHVLSCTVFA